MIYFPLIGKALTHDQYCCTVYVISVLLYLILGQVIPFAYFKSSFIELNTAALAIFIYAGLVVISLVSVVGDRVLRRDLASAQVR